MNKCMILTVAALAAFSSYARTFEVKMWRGETGAFWVPDYCEYGKVPAGIDIRFGVLKKVQYAPAPESVQRVECYDRVKWDEKGDGPRIAEVSVPMDAKPGDYDCGMMRVKVLDRVLPPAKEWKYYLDLWQHPWAVARMADVRPFSRGHYKAMKPVWELLASAGQKTITVSILEQPWDHQCFDAYHSMVEDENFETFDEYVQFAKECGLGPDIACYSLCPWTLDKEIDVDKLEAQWGSFLDRFATHLKLKGWFKDTIMAMDERKPGDVKKVYDFVQKHAPGMRISMASNRKPSEFKGIRIDVFSQSLNYKQLTSDFLEEAKERREQKLVTTHYICCGPRWPNTFLESGAGEAFWCAVCPAFLGLDGMLRWAWNSWPKDPEKDGTYWNWRAGDTFLCYPEGQPSWRFLELRNGIIAAEKVRLLKEWGQLPTDFEKIAKKFDVREANENKTNFRELRNEVLDFVNR